MATVAEMMETQATETLAQLSLFISNVKDTLSITLIHVNRDINQDGYSGGISDLQAANNSARAASYLEQDLNDAHNYQEDMTDEDVLNEFSKKLNQRLYIRSNAASASVEELKVLIRALRYIS